MCAKIKFCIAFDHLCDFTWLSAFVSQHPDSEFIRQEVESITGYVPQGQGPHSPEEPPDTLLSQDHGHTVHGASVLITSQTSPSFSLALQADFHQVYGSSYKHLHTRGFIIASIDACINLGLIGLRLITSYLHCACKKYLKNIYIRGNLGLFFFTCFSPCDP